MHRRRFLENEPANFPDGNECTHIWTLIPHGKRGNKKNKEQNNVFQGNVSSFEGIPFGEDTVWAAMESD